MVPTYAGSAMAASNGSSTQMQHQLSEIRSLLERTLPEGNQHQVRVMFAVNWLRLSLRSSPADLDEMMKSFCHSVDKLMPWVECKMRIYVALCLF